MDEEEKKVVNYRKEQAIKIIDQYKDLMTKYDLVFDIDALEKEIQKANNEEEKNEAEKKLLDKLDNRRKALEKKEEILNKISSLEKHIGNDSQEEEETNEAGGHISNKYRRKD